MVKCNIAETQAKINAGINVENNKHKLKKLQRKLKEYELQFKSRGAEM